MPFAQHPAGVVRPVNGTDAGIGLGVCVLGKASEGLFVDPSQHDVPIARLAEVAIDECVEGGGLARNKGQMDREVAFVRANDKPERLGRADAVQIVRVSIVDPGLPTRRL